MFQQDITLGPGNGTFTSHTMEIFLMLFVSFLLGAWLGWVMWNRYQVEAEQLRLDLAASNATLISLRTETESSRTRIATLEGETTHLRAENDNLQRELTSLREKLASTDTLLAQTMTRNRQLETELGLTLGGAAPATTVTVPLEVVTTTEQPVKGILTEENKTTESEPPLAAVPGSTDDTGSSTIRVIDRATDQAVTVKLDRPSSEVEIQLEGGSHPASTTPETARDILFEPDAPGVTTPSVTVITPSPVHPLLSIPDDLPADTPAPSSGNPTVGAEPDDHLGHAGAFPPGAPPADKNSRIDPSEVFDSPGFIAINTLHGRDNLQMLEGIGPAEEALLNQNGLYTYQDLARTDSAHLENLLQGAGRAFNGIDPATWPAQANLAASGQWEALRSVQNIMRSGKQPG